MGSNSKTSQGFLELFSHKDAGPQTTQRREKWGLGLHLAGAAACQPCGSLACSWQFGLLVWKNLNFLVFSFLIYLF